jgi:hypothetical protein
MIAVRPGEAEILTTFSYIEKVLDELPYEQTSTAVYG